VLSAVVGKDGNIENLQVLSGPSELQQASLDAVRQWMYKPYLLNGDPVEVKTTVNVVYTLQPLVSRK
jgi:TonB family protein